VLAAAAMIVAAGQACLAQTNYNEVEPNDDKAHATVIGAMAPGDTLTGFSTGNTVLNDSAQASSDYWNVTTTAAGTPGIYQYQLNINEAASTGHSMFIQGLSQSNGVISTSDVSVQSSTPSIARSLRWYANETPSHIYVKVTGNTTTTSNYVMTLTRTPVTPTALNSFNAGPLSVSSVGQSTSDTEFWLYDSNFNAIVDAGNDNEPSPGTSTQSRLQRNLPAGTYILAVATANLANNLASPADDRQRSRPVLDFPNAICTSSAPGSNDNHNFVIGNVCTGGTQSITDNASQHFLIVTFYTVTLTGSQQPDPITFSATAATPATVVQGNSTVLTVTAAGGTPTSVTADLSPFGLTSTEAFHDDGQNGDAAAGDNIWSYQLAVPASQPTGPYTLNVSSTTSGPCPAPTGTLALTVSVPPPPNNTCATAVPISVGNSYPGTTLGAAAAGGLAAACNTIVGTTPGVWYTFTEGPTSRRLVCSLCDPATNFNAMIALYTGSCGALTCVWGNEGPGFGCPYQNAARNNGGTAHSDIPAIINWTPGQPAYKSTTPNTTYYICVLNSSTSPTIGGNFVLHLDDTGENPDYNGAPFNDVCANARDLATFQSGVPLHTGFPVWDLVFRDKATQTDPPVSCGAPTNTYAPGSIWYTFTPSTQGNLFHAKIPDQSQATRGGADDTVVTVFTGSCAGGLTEVPGACIDLVEGYTNMFTTPIAALSAGVTYFIEVSQYEPPTGSTTIRGGEYIGFDFVPTAPQNGSCCTVNRCDITTQAACTGTWTPGGTCTGPSSCPQHCGSSDFNCDGDVGTDADIESFFACLSGTCPPLPCISNADFNGDGDTGTDSDIEAFFRVLAGGAC
jgi:hypothetical protein